MPEKQYRIPDLLRNWPWTRSLSPYYAEAKEASSSWIHSFHLFDKDGQRAFDACDLSLLASLTYSHRNKDFIRLGCDLMGFYFAYDEYTDVSNFQTAEKLANIVLDNMKHPDNGSIYGSHILGEMKQQFWKKASALVKPGSSCLDRFISTSENYLHSVALEADDRASKKIRSVDDYLPLRRETCGARPALALTEFGLDLPNEVISHPTLVSLTECAADLLILGNDMHSYFRELSCGQANHNIITCIMAEEKLDLQAAFDWLGTYADKIIRRFLSESHQIPSWNTDIDAKVAMYIKGLGQWVRGNDDWSYESKRYYGEDGMKVRATRRVRMRPTRVRGHYLKSVNDSALARVCDNYVRLSWLKIIWSFSFGNVLQYFNVLKGFFFRSC